MRKLLDSLENAQKAWVDLKKDAKGAHKLFKDYQPEEDLVKREKIIYTGSVKDFVRAASAARSLSQSPCR